MRAIYHFFDASEDGEAEGFFDLVDKKLVLVACWASDDGNWRSEYMGGLLTYLGVKEKELPKKFHTSARKAFNQAFGFSE